MPKAKVVKSEPAPAPKPEKPKAVALPLQILEPAVGLPGVSAADVAEKVKELVRLAQEQGHLTFNDINEVLPEHDATPEKLDELFTKLRALEIEIVDQAEVDHVKKPENEEEDTTRLDILADPVRMYLNQMG